MTPSNTPSHVTVPFIEFLSEALPYVDNNTPTHINAGGCGVFAKLLLKKLQSMGYSPTIVALLGDAEENEGQKNFMAYVKTGRVQHPIGVSHVQLNLDGFYLDSTGIANSQALATKKEVEMTEAQLDLLLEKADWRDIFDKGCTHIIANLLEDAFSKMSEFHHRMFPSPDNLELSKNTIKAMQREKKAMQESIMDNPMSLFSRMFSNNENREQHAHSVKNKTNQLF